MSGQQPIPSDETLLGYILGGLSDQENAEIEEMLTRNESLRVRLRDLRSMLEPLADEPSADPEVGPPPGLIGPPPGLIEQTMAAIAQQSQDLLDASSSQASRPEDASPEHASPESGAPDEHRVQEYTVCETHAAEVPSNRVAWLDSLVTLAAGIIVLSFALPGILRWRESARQQECAENLRNLGSALSSFALFQPSHRLPAIEPSGPLAFAGVYSIRLQDNHLLDSKRWLQCPNESSTNWLVSIPTSQQFIDAPEPKRFVWRMLAGGDYAYHMGSIVEGKYQAPSIESPARVAWIGDRWPVDLDQPLSDRDFEQHGTRGLNVLYSDGSVQWLKLPKIHELASIDHPYLNRELKQAPGFGEADACLGPSHLLPIRAD